MSGRRPAVPVEDILELFAEGPDPAYGTTELAEVFGYTQAGMHRRLTELQESGQLASKNVGSSIIWWITEDGESYVND